MSALHDIGYEFERSNPAERLSRVREQIHGFERELFDHQLNLTRLHALPEAESAAEQQDLDQQLALANDAVKKLKSAIEATKNVEASMTPTKTAKK